MTSQNHTSTLTDLQPGERYKIQVKTVTTKGDSPFSGSMVVTTDEMTQTLTQKMKKDLGITALESKVVSINWKITLKILFSTCTAFSNLNFI